MQPIPILRRARSRLGRPVGNPCLEKSSPLIGRALCVEGPRVFVVRCSSAAGILDLPFGGLSSAPGSTPPGGTKEDPLPRPAAHGRDVGAPGGVHPKIVQEMLGHSQISITLDIYSHVLPGMGRAAAVAMDILFSRTGGQSLSRALRASQLATSWLLQGSRGKAWRYAAGNGEGRAHDRRNVVSPLYAVR